MILKTRTFELPLGGGARVDGEAAVWGGVGLIAIGLVSLVTLVWTLLA
jgi:hypothetical protein